MKKYIYKGQKKKFYIGILMGCILLALLVMPFWRIQKIDVINNSYYTQEELLKIADLGEGNVLNVSFKEMKARLSTLPYIKEVKVTYQFPGKLTIDVVEKEPFIYVPFMGSYLCLNEQGQVLEESQQMLKGIPLVNGLVFSQFKVGEKLDIQNDDTLLCTREIMQALKNRGYNDKINKIDVYNLEEIHLYVDNLDVIMGDIGDFDKKLQWLIEVHKEYDMGVLDLTNLIRNGQAPLWPIK